MHQPASVRTNRRASEDKAYHSDRNADNWIVIGNWASVGENVGRSVISNPGWTTSVQNAFIRSLTHQG